MVWWILLGILVLLLILPLGISARYDAEGICVRVVAGPIRFTVFPRKKNTPKKEKPKADTPGYKKSEAPADIEASAETAEKTADASNQQPVTDNPKPTPLPEAPKPPAAVKESAGGSLKDFLPLVELALQLVGEFFHRTIHIDVLYVKVTLAGDDPADLAILYGNAWAALGNLWPYLDRMFTIKNRDVQIQCDFQAVESLVTARVDLTVTLARLFGLLFTRGVPILVKFWKIMNLRKKQSETVNQK